MVRKPLIFSTIIILSVIMTALSGCLEDDKSDNNNAKPIEVEITSHNSYIDESDGLHIVGIVENNADSNIENVKVIVRLYDRQKCEIDTLDTYTSLNIIEAGERSPFNIFIEKPGNYDSYDVELVSYEKTKDSPYNGLEVQTSTAYNDSNKWYHVEGEIKNNGSEYILAPSVYVVIFNYAGDILDVNTEKTIPLNLFPDEVGSFESIIITDFFNYDITQYEIFINID